MHIMDTNACLYICMQMTAPPQEVHEKIQCSAKQAKECYTVAFLKKKIYI